MTLATNVVITSPMASVQEVFNYCRELLGAMDSRYKDTIRPGDLYLVPGETPSGERTLANYLGQGYAAALSVTYHPDGPLKQEHPKGFLRICFDTQYAYRGPNGGDCNDLHAWLVTEVSDWCAERGWGCWWMNEYTAEWFRGTNGIAGFGDSERGSLLAP